MGVASNVSSAQKTFGALAGLALTGLILLIIFGNLSGNVGFAANTQGANDTGAIIGNITGGVTTFFGFAGVWFTLLAVVLLITIVVGIMGAIKSKSGDSFSS